MLLLLSEQDIHTYTQRERQQTKGYIIERRRRRRSKRQFFVYLLVSFSFYGRFRLRSPSVNVFCLLNITLEESCSAGLVLFYITLSCWEGILFGSTRTNFPEGAVDADRFTNWQRPTARNQENSFSLFFCVCPLMKERPKEKKEKEKEHKSLCVCVCEIEALAICV